MKKVKLIYSKEYKAFINIEEYKKIKLKKIYNKYHNKQNQAFRKLFSYKYI